MNGYMLLCILLGFVPGVLLGFLVGQTLEPAFSWFVVGGSIVAVAAGLLMYSLATDDSY